LHGGYVVNWTPEEDNVVIEFVKSCMSNPELTWQNCSDAVNQYLATMGFSHKRSAEACSERWIRHLKNGKSCFPLLRKPRSSRRYQWTEDKNDQLVESVKRNTNDERTDWEAVSQEMGGDRTAVQCRAHYNVLASRGLSFEETPEDFWAHEGFENLFEGSPFEDY
jgi:hypothetical protein